MSRWGPADTPAWLDVEINAYVLEIYVYSLVKPKDYKEPVGAQQNKHQPNISSLWIVAY